MSLMIPPGVRAVAADPRLAVWLEGLPHVIQEFQERWQLLLESDVPFDEASCSWVARARRRDGTRAVFKVGMPIMQSRHEIDGLRFWNGDPTVYLLEADEIHNVLLLERCEPGTPLAALPESEQDEVIATMLRRLWRRLPGLHPFRPLSEMIAPQVQSASTDLTNCPDAGLLQEGLRLYDELAQTATEAVLLATDLHAWNVLRAEREEWLVIDPMPFVGDPVYDATQHLLNCKERLRADPIGTIRRFAELLEIDAQRLHLWVFARFAVMSRGGKYEPDYTLARALA